VSSPMTGNRLKDMSYPAVSKCHQPSWTQTSCICTLTLHALWD
jgi:hypothetical protein